MRIAKNLDLLVLAIALPIFLVAGLPMAGFAVGAGLYLAQKGVAIYLTNKAQHAESPGHIVGVMAGSMIGRGWIVALAIFGAGMLWGRAVGLTSALVFLAAFSAYFVTSMILRPMEEIKTAPR